MSTLEERVQRLEDIEDIRRLKIRYAQFCDAQYDPDGIASCFTDDAVSHMAKTSFTSVGSLADSPAPLLRPSPATDYAAEILDVDDPDLGYDADPCP
jgi:SnoaL-like domain